MRSNMLIFYAITNMAPSLKISFDTELYVLILIFQIITSKRIHASHVTSLPDFLKVSTTSVITPQLKHEFFCFFFWIKPSIPPEVHVTADSSC